MSLNYRNLRVDELIRLAKYDQDAGSAKEILRRALSTNEDYFLVSAAALEEEQESDRARISEEAYEEGFKAGQEEAEEAYEEGFAAGREAAAI